MFFNFRSQGLKLGVNYLKLSVDRLKLSMDLTLKFLDLTVQLLHSFSHSPQDSKILKGFGKGHRMPYYLP